MTIQQPVPLAPLTCFKAYDIRGRLGEDLDEKIGRRVARAFVDTLNTKRVVVGRDCRLSSKKLADAVCDGLVAAGVEVLDLGLSGTEEMYFSTSHFGACGGIEITASHNPIDYNGMKMVKKGSAPLDPKTEMEAIRNLAENGSFSHSLTVGSIRDISSEARAAYIERVISFVDISQLRPLKILVNSGNGTAGPTFDAIAEALEAKGAPLTFHRIHHDVDGTFPNGIPNPLLPENQPVTAEAVRQTGADLGIAWDGDFDRCFLFDHEGNFVPGEYVVGLLAQAFLEKEPGATIVHDPRIVWNTRAVIEKAEGKAKVSRTGHVFLKQALREADAIYGGEMSAHHYFRDFMCCDSGMIPWLLITELLGRSGAALADLLSQARSAFPSSGEINFQVAAPNQAMAHVFLSLKPEVKEVDRLDGLSLTFSDWQLNLRPSNTEPVLRLNVESRGNAKLLQDCVSRVAALIESKGVLL